MPAVVSRNSRAAGRRFEQRIARDLRGWLGDEWTVTRNPTDRQAGQGGCAGEFKICGPYRFPFTIECKDGCGFDPRQLWRSPIPGPLGSTPSKRGFWQQAREQADSVGLAPLLVFRRASTGTVLAAARGGCLSSIGSRMVIEIGAERVSVCRWSAIMDTPASILYELAQMRRLL